MIRSSVTVSLVPQARGGPFIFWDGLSASFISAKRLGFDGIEIFAPSGEVLERELEALGPEAKELKIAAVGTGAGWVLHQLTLTSANDADRQQARDFIRAIIDAGGKHGAPAIIGSMQGRWAKHISRDRATDWLRDGLEELGAHAEQYDVPLLFEPLNRYETNLVNTLADGVRLLESLSCKNVRLLADLFHMNIEETEVAEAINAAGSFVGHVHFADSNRRPIGFGHTDMRPIADALSATRYDGFVSAECLAWPDPESAAAETIRAFNTLFRGTEG